MKNLTLAHIAEACHGTYVGTEEKKNQEVSSIYRQQKGRRGRLICPNQGSQGGCT